jgi:hypothetical protein
MHSSVAFFCGWFVVSKLEAGRMEKGAQFPVRETGFRQPPLWEAPLFFS